MNNRPVIVIPMAGLSARFAKAGYTLPKYMLYAHDKSLFNLAVSSFERYFDEAHFVFVARNVFDTKTFIENECELLGVKSFHVVILDQPTKGQAETVLLGLEKAGVSDDASILIFNIDTFRPGFTFPEAMGQWDGYLEVFAGSGTNWSYARTESVNSTRVVETAEKKEISQFCSTGIYFFKKSSDFKDAYAASGSYTTDRIQEYYVAPLYNELIKKGKDIHINLIRRDEVVFCGVPQEYTDYLKKTVAGV